jgi:hypothetical protein
MFTTVDVHVITPALPDHPEAAAAIIEQLH